MAGNGGISIPALAALLGAGVLLVTSGGLAPAGEPLTPELMTQPGRDVAAQGVRVEHVAADEGFWIDLIGDRVWVQLIGTGESPYIVRDGATVSFTGRVVAHDDTFPNGLGMCSPADAAALAAEDTHIAVPYGDLTLG